MKLVRKIWRKKKYLFKVTEERGVESGSISQRYGPGGLDPHQHVTDHQHCIKVNSFFSFCWQEERTSAAPAGDWSPLPAREGVRPPRRRSEAARSRRYQVREQVVRKQCWRPESRGAEIKLPPGAGAEITNLRPGSKPTLRILSIYQRLSISFLLAFKVND